MESAIQFITSYGWGAQGKMLGISRMFQENDLNLLKKMQCVASTRPRGVLSGFLAIVPVTKQVVYLPPIGGKIPAKPIRMRIAEEVFRDGAILSCYWEDSDLILEDVLVWRGTSVWQTVKFQERWNVYMKYFSDAWQPDKALQGCTVRCTEYQSLEQLQKPEGREVIEFVPDSPNTKRLIWVPTEEMETKSYEEHIVKREAAIGPDIFSVWSKTQERLGIAYIRTLAMSKLLRLHPVNEFSVKTQWNKMFERHEILGLA